MDSPWHHVRRVLKQTLNAEQFSQWIKPLKSSALPSGDLMLEAPSRFHYDWIQEHYLSLIESCCHKIDSRVRVLFKMPDGGRKTSKVPGPYIGLVPLTTSFQASQTFDSYIVASFNHFAYAAAQDVCQGHALKFNPLFVEGPPGLGKTHLLHAIGNASSGNSDGTTAYLDCRNFHAYETSVPPASSATIWQSLSGVRILLVDDVHLLPAQGGFHQHLREIFNLCYDSDTQMVFAATRLPHQIPDLPLGLRSRLGWGLIARIREPDLKGCYQVIETFLDETEIPVSPDVCQHLAEQGPLNFHEIKDSVERLQELVKKEGHLPNLKEKSLAIHGSVTSRPEKLSIQTIQQEVCAAYAVAPEALPGATKARPLVIARQVGMYLSRKLTSSTYAAIGEAFGGRDHSTVIYACRKVRAEMRRNRQFAERIVEIEKKFLGAFNE